jgi:adenine C2-methylase RlmN of 23S rRNA A2503 and tRNA A37
MKSGASRNLRSAIDKAVCTTITAFEYRFMGIGEPLMNYNNVLKAIEMITSPEGLGMSKTDHGFYFWCSKMIKNWQMTTSNSNWQFLCTPQLMKSVPNHAL